jgi:hypothetical protein
VSSDIKDGDPEVATLIARQLKLDHEFIERRSDRFAEWFTEVNYLVDGLNEIAAFHPHEYQIMKHLRDRGTRRVIRGDEALGTIRPVETKIHAAALFLIRSFSGVDHLRTVVHDKWYQLAAEASDADIAMLLARYEDMNPGTFKDAVFFTQRLPNYMMAASYYKQIQFDHRNPLLSNAILDFYQCVPDSLRLGKRLAHSAFASAFPDLAAIPYAKRHGLEDWISMMGRDTPLRRYMQKQFLDRESGIWEFFDFDRVQELFSGLSSLGGRPQASRFLRSTRVTVRKALDAIFPLQMGSVMTKRARARLPIPKLLMRIMVLKNWHDQFVSGRSGLRDGDPPNLSRRT